MTKVMGRQSQIDMRKNYGYTTNVPHTGRVGGETMKTFMKGAIRDEKGAGVLALVLVLLVVGGLILTPLLGLMSTGLLAGQAYERHTDRLYAADAGIEDAIWKIQTQNLEFGTNNWSDPWHLTANGKNVTVVVYREDLNPDCGEEFMYRILSAAAADDGGGTAAIGTAIEAYLDVLALNLSYMLDYAIVTNETIDIQPNVTVNGSVWLPYEEDLSVSPGSNITGDTVSLSDGISLTWPTFDQLSEYYWGDVKDLDPYPAGYVLNIPSGTSQDSPYDIGPLLAAGNLDIKGDGYIKLNGTIYVKGDLVFKATPQINLNLNGQTIFAEGGIDIPPGVAVSDSGCIIAVGSIGFRPGIISSPDDFVLVMSIDGTVTIQPNGDFTGCVIGDEVVQLQPAQGEDFTIRWISPEGQELDFPGMNETDPEDLQITALRIESWEINPQ